jgi:hypothetical protein
MRFIVRSGKAPAKQRSWLAPQPAPPVPRPPAPAPPGGEPPAGPPASQPGPSTGRQALDIAAGYVGAPFVWGGASPATGFDDAGLVQYAYAQVGVALPRVADDQFRVGTAVARADLLPGDLVFFQDPSGYVDHVGLYAGDGQFLHAPHTGAVVSYDALSNALLRRALRRRPAVRLNALAREPAQAQRVADHRDAREDHRQAGDDGVEQADRGQRDRGDVVAEGPAEVLLDRAQRGAAEADGVGGGAQVAGDEREVGGLDGDVGAGADAQAEVGLGERGASLTPSPTMATTRPSACRRRIDVGLVGGQDLGDDLVDADLGGDRARRSSRCRRSAGRAAARAPSATRRLRGAVLDGVGDDEHGGGAPVPAGGDRGLPARLGGAAGGVELGRRCSAQSAEQRGPADDQRVAVDDALDPEALAVGEALDARQRPSAARGRAMAWAIGCSEACSSAPTSRSASSRSTPSATVTSTASSCRWSRCRSCRARRCRRGGWTPGPSGP